MEFPFVKQQNMGCGAACLYSIALFYKKNISHSYLFELCRTDGNGTSIYSLSLAAEEIGFGPAALKIDFECLKTSVILPAIAYLSHKHYVVIYKIDGYFVYISDPASGLMFYSHYKFLSLWLGHTNRTECEEGIILSLKPKI